MTEPCLILHKGFSVIHRVTLFTWRCAHMHIIGLYGKKYFFGQSFVGIQTSPNFYQTGFSIHTPRELSNLQSKKKFTPSRLFRKLFDNARRVCKLSYFTLMSWTCTYQIHVFFYINVMLGENGCILHVPKRNEVYFRIMIRQHGRHSRWEEEILECADRGGQH